MTIGYTAAGDPYENHDPSSDEIACENSPESDWNNVVYLLSDDDPQITIGIKLLTKPITVLENNIIVSSHTDNVTASDVGTSTTEVSWVVSYIPEQLEFTVYYGTDEDSLDSISDTVTSSYDDTSLTNQEYSVVLTGLSLGTTYYFKVEATYSDFTIESDVEDFTTYELGI